MSEDVIKKVQAVAVATEKVKEQQAELNKKIEQSYKNYDLALQAMKMYAIGAHRGLEDIAASTIRLNVDVQKLAQANKEGYEYLVKKNQAELQSSENQIAALSKNIAKREELINHINSQHRSLSPADISDFFGSQGRVHEPSFGRMFREGGQLPVMERMPNF